MRFRRHYEQLEFHIFYRNGADGCAPSPSEWDLTIAARVPAQELSQWTRELAPQSSRPAEAPGTLPGIDTKDIAARLGYQNPASSSRAFAQPTGKTPSAYRARCKVGQRGGRAGQSRSG